MQRPWGGHRLATDLGIVLPNDLNAVAALPIGELWALVDRPEAQSIVSAGPLQGKSLHELWREERLAIFGAKHLNNNSPRFPLICKILDAKETLSLQVHPRATTTSASQFRGESKTEFWYFLKADGNTCSYAGLKKGVTREVFEHALQSGTIEQTLHQLAPTNGDSLFLPSGRLHALGGGNLVIEIQQNSDTTYRVFDWNRRDNDGRMRTLHLEEAMESIDFEDQEPSLHDRRLAIASDYFHTEKWNLSVASTIETSDECAILTCVHGRLQCGNQIFSPGDFFLLPALREKTLLTPLDQETTLLCTRLRF